MVPLRLLTWANLLTAMRLLSILPLIYLMLNQQWAASAILFSLAALSDYFDGKLARSLNQTSPWGGLFDHATDAAMVAAGCWALAQVNLINGYLCWLIGAAFIQYMLDSSALAGRTLRTSVIGRSNGVAYFVLLGTAIGSELLGAALIQLVVPYAAWLLVASTLISILDRGWTLLRQSP